jgi:hypothetical protein
LRIYVDGYCNVFAACPEPRVGDGSYAIGEFQAFGNGYIDGPEPPTVPEPSTLAIFALGIVGLASRRFKKQS